MRVRLSDYLQLLLDRQITIYRDLLLLVLLGSLLVAALRVGQLHPKDACAFIIHRIGLCFAGITSLAIYLEGI